MDRSRVEEDKRYGEWMMVVVVVVVVMMRRPSVAETAEE